MSTEEVPIFQNAVCLIWTARRYGTTKKADKDKIQTDADKKRIGASKRILVCKENKAIVNADQKMRSKILEIALPSYFKAGIFVVEKTAIPILHDELENYSKRRSSVLVPALVEKLSETIDSDEQALNSQFNRSDYPTQEELLESFEVSWNWVNFETPELLKDVDEIIWKESREKTDVWLTDFKSTVQEMVVSQYVQILDEFKEKITTEKTGKGSGFRDSAIENISKFLNNLDFKAVTCGEQLMVLAAEGKEILKDVNIDQIRKDQNCKETLVNKFEELRGKVAGLQTDRKRTLRLNLGEE